MLSGRLHAARIVIPHHPGADFMLVLAKWVPPFGFADAWSIMTFVSYAIPSKLT